jgi:hypothetical protein
MIFADFPYASKEEFMKFGFILTILDTTREEEDCGICLKPLYAPKCDNEAHDHEACSSEQKDKTKPISAAPRDPLDLAHPGLKLVECGHVIGHKCALEWFDHSNTCPFCREEMFPKKEEELDWWQWREDCDEAQPEGRWMDGFF